MQGASHHPSIRQEGSVAMITRSNWLELTDPRSKQAIWVNMGEVITVDVDGLTRLQFDVREIDVTLAFGVVR